MALNSWCVEMLKLVIFLHVKRISYKLLAASHCPLFLTLLSPSIHVQILQTVLNTFPKECLENLIKDLCNFPLLITLIILTTISLENVFKLLGENWWWSNLRFTGLSSSRNLVVHLLQSMAWLFILLKIIVLNSKVISCVLTNNTFYN